MAVRGFKTTQIFGIFAVVACILGGASLATGLAWLRPTKIIDIRGIQIPNRVYRAGDIMAYDLDYCKYSDDQSEVHISWSDGVSYPMPGVTMRLLPQGCHVVAESVTVPNIPAGRYRLEMTRVYKPTPFRIVERSGTSNIFEIAAKK